MRLDFARYQASVLELVVIVGALQGRWRRSLLLAPHGRKDTVTKVTWLQAESMFADLRMPPNRPDFSAVSCLRDLSFDQLEWIASQEGFAGRLVLTGDIFEWRRSLDFQPRPVEDRARLRFEGDVLIEEGAEESYIEHWHRDAPAKISGALELRQADGLGGIFVAADSDFMIARACTVLRERQDLRDCLAEAPSLEAAQNLSDCEISLGSFKDGKFRIEHSTLPFREKRLLAPFCSADGTQFFHADQTPDGEPFVREWRVEAQEGNLSILKDDSGETPRRAASHAAQESFP